MIADIPTLCPEPDTVRQILGGALIFLSGAIAGVTACIALNQPKPQPWWMQE